VKRLDRDEELPNIVGELLSLDRNEQRAVVASIADARAVLPWRVAAVVGQLADRYPDDAGVAVGLLLNVVSLEPGDALYLPAGNMHAYLSGLGVEVMANSDNVLRGGLTPKHVDVPELVSTLVPLSGPWPLTRPESDPQHPGIAFFRSPSPEVGLAQLSLRGPDLVVPGSDGPTLLVVTEGSIGLSSDESTLVLAPGEAAYAFPGSHVTATGHGVLWASQVVSTRLSR
jgi:mannose-6-phosphate isomerase